ncbi:MAG TPA: ankyrin repeat domain-containing protein [Gemmataceae bacterium]|nr:ankyrin repeat domain-containing protein [Gemmataceae bacterium]
MDNPIRRSADPITAKHLDAAEEILGVRLPAEYRDFLLAHNGGYPRRNTFYHTSGKGKHRETWLNVIYSVGRDGIDDPTVADLLSANADRPVGLPAGVVFVAAANYMGNTGHVCIGCDGDRSGNVYFRPDVEPEKATLYPVADSWPAFLAGMSYRDGKPKKWQDLVYAGDADGLQAWLARSNKWYDGRDLAIEVADCAIEEGQWDILEVLMGHGDRAMDWTPGELFERSLQYHRFRLALRLLDGGDVPTESIERALLHAGNMIWHDPETLRRLIAAGADVNAEAETGDTPLHGAVEAGSLDAVELLISHGADPTVRNDDQRTPLALAHRLEHPRLFPILKAAEEAWANRPRTSEPDLMPFDLGGVTIPTPGAPLTLDAVKAVETEWGIDLPPAYRWFLTQANGGDPDPAVLTLPEEFHNDDEDDSDPDDEDDRLDDGPDEHVDPTVSFFALRNGQQPPSTNEYGWAGHSVESARGYYHDGDSFPRGTLPIALLDGYGVEGSAWLLIGLKGKARGQIFVHNYGSEPLGVDLPGLFRMLSASKDRPASPGERLVAAIQAGDLGGITAAIAAGASPTRPNRAGEAPLTVALDVGFDDAVLAMIDAGTNVDDVFGDIVARGRTELVRRLLDRTPRPNPKTIREALLYPSDLWADAGLIRTLLAATGDAKKKSREPMQYIHTAALAGHPAGLAVILDAGADPNAPSHDGSTPLRLAAQAVPGGPANYVQAMMALAGGKPVEAPVAQPGTIECVKLLLARGAEVNAANAQGETALHAAVERGDVAMAKALIDAGADLHAKYEISIPGMSAAKKSKLMRESMAAMAEMMSMFGAADEDAPPLDTSTPLGEKLAGAAERIQAMKDKLIAGPDSPMARRMAEMAQGSLGKGPSAAEIAARNPTLLAELEAYANAKAGGAA